MLHSTIPVHLRFDSSSHQHTTGFCSLQAKIPRTPGLLDKGPRRAHHLLVTGACHNEAISNTGSHATKPGLYHQHCEETTPLHGLHISMKYVVCVRRKTC